MLTKSCKNVALNLYCNNCDYNTDRKSSFNKHLLTSKHLKLTLVNKICNKNCEMDINKFICDFCSKQFKSRVGLWKHKKNAIMI